MHHMQNFLITSHQLSRYIRSVSDSHFRLAGQQISPSCRSDPTSDLVSFCTFGPSTMNMLSLALARRVPILTKWPRLTPGHIFDLIPSKLPFKRFRRLSSNLQRLISCHHRQILRNLNESLL